MRWAWNYSVWSEEMWTTFSPKFNSMRLKAKLALTWAQLPNSLVQHWVGRRSIPELVPIRAATGMFANLDKFLRLKINTSPFNGYAHIKCTVDAMQIHAIRHTGIRQPISFRVFHFGFPSLHRTARLCVPRDLALARGVGAEKGRKHRVSEYFVPANQRSSEEFPCNSSAA